MTSLTPDPEPTLGAGPADHGKAGRDLPAAVGSAAVLLGVVAASLLVWKAAFVAVVVLAVVVGIWELSRSLQAHGIDLPRGPLMLASGAMVTLAFGYGATALVAATALCVLALMLWLLRRGVTGYVAHVTATVFTVVYLPFLASFVVLLLAEGGWRGGGLSDLGVRAVIVFILVTAASDIGGYAVGVVLGRHPMAPVISPKKSWEGFAGSVLACAVAGAGLVAWLLDGPVWVGVLVGLVTAVVATLGDLCESVIKRDLGIKDMSRVIPGHGGLMDRLDSLLATVAPIWLLLHYLVF